MKRVYLDNAATTPMRPEVLEAMLPFFAETSGNPSSLHTFGQMAKRRLEGARHTVARELGASDKEIYFTGGGTASDNLAIKGVAYAQRGRGKHLITSAIEHHAVLHTCRYLETQGYEVSYLPVNREGIIDLDALAKELREDTILVSVMLANNEVGTIQPLRQVVELAKRKGALVHTDAVQAMGKMAVNVDDLGVDLLSLTAHKFYGPKGTGALYVRADTRVVPLVHGGHQERELCPGTENIPGIVGLAKALELANRDLDAQVPPMIELRDRLEMGIRQRIGDVHLNGHRELRVPNILNLSFEHVEGESLLLALDTQGIAVSTGSACSAGSTDPSHVLMAMGLESRLAQGSLRFSLGRDNTAEEIDYVLDALDHIVARLREMSPLYQAGPR